MDSKMKKIKSLLSYFRKTGGNIIAGVAICGMIATIPAFNFVGNGPGIKISPEYGRYAVSASGSFQISEKTDIKIADMEKAFGLRSDLNTQLVESAEQADEQANGINNKGDIDAIGTSNIILNTAIAYEDPLTEGQEFTSSTTFLNEEFDLKEKILDVTLDLIEHPDINNLLEDADTFEALKKETAQKLKAALEGQELYGDVLDDSEIEDLAEGMLLNSVYGESLNYYDLEDIYSDTITDLDDKEFMAVFGESKEEWYFEADLTKMVDTIIEATEGIELSDEEHLDLIEETAKKLNFILEDNGYGYVLDKSDLEAQAMDIIYSISIEKKLNPTELEVLIKDTKDSIEEQGFKKILDVSEEEFNLKEKIIGVALDISEHPDINNLFKDAETFEALKKETAQKLKAALEGQELYTGVLDDSEIEDMAEGMLLNNAYLKDKESLNYDDLEDIYSDTRTDLEDKEFMAVFGKSKEEWNFEADFTKMVDTMRKDIAEMTEGIELSDLSDEDHKYLIEETAKAMNLILKDSGYGYALEKIDLEAQAADIVNSIGGKEELSSNEVEVLIEDTTDSIREAVLEEIYGENEEELDFEEVFLKEKIMDVALDLIENPDIDSLFEDADTFEALKIETAQKLKAALEGQEFYGNVLGDSEIEDLAEGMLLQSVYGESLDYDDLEDIYNDTIIDLEDKEFTAVYGISKEEFDFEAGFTYMVEIMRKELIEMTEAEGIELSDLSDEEYKLFIGNTANELRLMLKEAGYGDVLDKSDLVDQAADIIISIGGKEKLSPAELEVLIKDTKDSIEEQGFKKFLDVSVSEEELDLEEKILEEEIIGIALELSKHPGINDLSEDTDEFEDLKKETVQKLKAAFEGPKQFYAGAVSDSEIEDMAEDLLLINVYLEGPLDYDGLKALFSDTIADQDDKEFVAVYGKSKEEWNFEADLNLVVGLMKKEIAEVTEGIELSDEDRKYLIEETAKELSLILKDNGYGDVLDKSDLEAQAADMIYSIENKEELSPTELEVLIKDIKDSIEEEVSEKFTEFSIPDMGQEILELLEENDLPSDDLTLGIVKSIWNILEENIPNNTNEDDKNNIMVEIIKGLLDSEKQGDIVSTDGSSEIIEAIRNELNKNGMLEDQTLIESREALNKAKNYKEFLQKELSYYNDLEAKGYEIVDSWHYDGLKNSLKDISIKISELENDLKDFEEVIVVEEDLTEETGEAEEEVTEELPSEEEVTEEIVDSEEESEEITEEVTEEVAAEVITLNGTYSGPDYPDFGSFTMYMSIDLKTGTVSGTAFVKMKNENVDLDYDFPISGSMNLETREITGKFGDDKMNGKLSADSNRANGTGEEGIVWSVSR